MRWIPLVFLLHSCATATQPVRVVQNLYTPVYAGEVSKDFDWNNAADLLTLGMTQFGDGLYGNAIESFQLAIETADLNEEGYTLCYWHIAVSHDMLNHPQEAAEAFHAFVVHANWVIEEPSRQLDMRTEFNLDMRIQFAVDFINELWDSYHADESR